MSYLKEFLEPAKLAGRNDGTGLSIMYSAESIFRLLIILVHYFFKPPVASSADTLMQWKLCTTSVFPKK